MNIEETLGYQIKRMALLLSRVTNQYLQENGGKDIPELQVWVLSYLSAHQDEKIFQVDLQEAFDLKKSTVSELIERMRTNDLITLRVSQKSDKRYKQICMTSKSFEKIKSIHTVLDKLDETLSEDFSKRELKNFFTFSEKMILKLKEEAINNEKIK